MNIGAECAEHKEHIEEALQSVSSNELSLVCEEEEKLEKLCPKLEPIKLDGKQQANKLFANLSPAVMGIYIVSTLGEPY